MECERGRGVSGGGRGECVNDLYSFLGYEEKKWNLIRGFCGFLKDIITSVRKNILLSLRCVKKAEMESCLMHFSSPTDAVETVR